MCVCVALCVPNSVMLSEQKLSFGKVGFSKAMSNKWIKVDKTHEGGARVFRTVSPPHSCVCVCVCVCVSSFMYVYLDALWRWL